MTGLYVKLDASYHDDPKLCEVSAEAELLYVRILCYCKRLGNDGSLHMSRVTSVTPTFRVTLDPLELLSELVEVGLLERTPTGWVVTAWLRHNPAPEDIDRAREQAKLRKRSQRDRERASRSGHAVTGHASRDQPEPEPEPEPVSPPNPPQRVTPSPAAGDPTDGLTDMERTVVTALVAAKVDRAKARPTDPAGYRRAVARSVVAEHLDEIRSTIARYPSAPASMLAAAVLGEPSPYLAQHRAQPEPPPVEPAEVIWLRPDAS